MADVLYQVHEFESGTHILIFKEDAEGYLFDQKIFVPVSEYHPDNVASVLDGEFLRLFTGSHKFVLNWIRENRSKNEEVRMVGVGKDIQLFSVDEYIFHYG